jgi:hypothetical protein
VKSAIVKVVGTAATTLAASLAVTLLSAVPANATHDSEGWVDKGEFREAHKGMSLRSVDRLFDTYGRLEYQGGGYMYRSYPAWYAQGCNYRVYVDYKKIDGAWRLQYKSLSCS